jgi:hypothetical protein
MSSALRQLPPGGRVRSISGIYFNGLFGSYLYHSGRLDTTLLPFDELR